MTLSDSKVGDFDILQVSIHFCMLIFVKAADSTLHRVVCGRTSQKNAKQHSKNSSRVGEK